MCPSGCSLEVFLPERYKVTNFGGDAVVAELLPEDTGRREVVEHRVSMGPLFQGQLGGATTDVSGAVVPHAHVTVVDVASGATKKTDADDSGRWVVSNVTSGKIRIMVDSAGFQRAVLLVDYNSYRPGFYPTRLQVGAVMETIEVTAAAAPIATLPSAPPEKKQEAPAIR